MVRPKALHPLVALAALSSVGVVAVLDGTCVLAQGTPTAGSDAVLRAPASSSVITGRKVQTGVLDARVSVAA